MSTENLKAFIFDLDGTVYLGDEILPGAQETLQWVRDIGAKVKFVTNNPRFSRKFYTEKLNNLGIKASEEEIVTSANITASYLKENDQYGKVFAIGEEQLLSELKDAGLEMTDDDPDTVIVSFDTTLTYEKLMVAFKALNNGAHFVATNPDSVCPTPEGGLVDAGAIIAALEASTGRQIEEVIGKPSGLLAEMLLKQLDVSPEQCVVVGDRLNTDMKLAKSAGMVGAWINANGEEMPSNAEQQPEIVINSIAELPSMIEGTNGGPAEKTS